MNVVLLSKSFYFTKEKTFMNLKLLNCDRKSEYAKQLSIQSHRRTGTNWVGGLCLDCPKKLHSARMIYWWNPLFSPSKCTKNMCLMIQVIFWYFQVLFFLLIFFSLIINRFFIARILRALPENLRDNFPAGGGGWGLPSLPLLVRLCSLLDNIPKIRQNPPWKKTLNLLQRWWIICMPCNSKLLGCLFFLNYIKL